MTEADLNPVIPGDRWSRWMGSLAADLRVMLGLLAITSLARIAMVSWEHQTFAPETGWGAILSTLHSGLRLDMPMASAPLAATAGLGLLCLLGREPLWTMRLRRVLRSILLVGIVALTPLLTAVELGFIGEYGHRFDNTLFAAAHDDVGAIARTIWQAWPILRILALSAVLGAGGTWLAWRLCRPTREQPIWLARLPVWGRLGLTVAAGLLAIFFWRGSLSPTTRWNMHIAISGQDHRLDQLVMSSWKALHRAWITHRRFIGNDGGRVFLPDGDLAAAGRRWAGHDAPDIDSLTARTAQGGRPSPPRHVVVVVLESYSAWALADRWRDLRLAEGMRALGGEGALLTRCISAGDYTMRSLGPIIGGVPYAGLDLPYTPTAAQPYPTSLPDTFRRLGYRTRLYYAGYASWQNLDVFARNQGFDETFCGGRLGLDAHTGNEWGLPDTAFFPAVLAQLDDSTPTFSLVISVGNHEPYDTDLAAAAAWKPSLPPAIQADPAIDAQVFGHFWLMDREFTGFARAVRERLPGLLLAATGDHYGRHIPSLRPTLAERTLVPLLLWGPGLDRGLPPDQAGSHLDIGPTLIERCAPAGFAYHAFGHDLLSEHHPRRGIGQTVVVTPNAIVGLNGFSDEVEGCDADTARQLRQTADDEHALGWWRERYGPAWPALPSR